MVTDYIDPQFEQTTGEGICDTAYPFKIVIPFLCVPHLAPTIVKFTVNIMSWPRRSSKPEDPLFQPPSLISSGNSSFTIELELQVKRCYQRYNLSIGKLHGGTYHDHIHAFDHMSADAGEMR